nr:hypothetical protein [Pseudomonas amygdali]
MFYLIVSLQGAFQALMPVNRLTHFSDWVWPFASRDAGFCNLRCRWRIAHAWQRIPNNRYSAAAMNWAYWLITIGLLAMFTTLTAGGLVQAQIWETTAPWMDSVRASLAYWWIRDLSGLPILAGFIAFFLGLTTGARNNGAAVSTSPVIHPTLAGV